MSRIRGKNTKLEMAIRKMPHAGGVAVFGCEYLD